MSNRILLVASSTAETRRWTSGAVLPSISPTIVTTVIPSTVLILISMSPPSTLRVPFARCPRSDQQNRAGCCAVRAFARREQFHHSLPARPIGQDPTRRATPLAVPESLARLTLLLLTPQ